MTEFRYCPRCATPLEIQPLAGLDRAACPDPACGFVHWGNPVPVVAALVELEGRILMARNHAWPEKTFGLIAGFLERDETPEEAIRREIREEVALETEALSLIGIYPFARRNEIIIVYHAHARGQVRLNEELAEFRLIEPARLRPWDYGTGLAVRDWLQRAGLGAGE